MNLKRRVKNIQYLGAVATKSSLGLTTNAQGGLGQLTESLPNGIVCPLFQIPRGTSLFLSKQQIYREKQIEALKELTKLMELVTEQEKKYGDRLSLYSHFHCRPLLIQQFFQTQLKNQPSQFRRDLSLTVLHAFGRDHHIARSIVQ